MRSNAKGGKLLCLEPLFWQSEASLEIAWEPRAFSEGQRPSVSSAGGRVRARLRREAHARGRAPAAAALCEAIARLDFVWQRTLWADGLENYHVLQQRHTPCCFSCTAATTA